MKKNFLKKFIPAPEKIQNNKHLKMFGKILQDPNLWHVNRRSVSRAVSIGLFSCYLPFPGHTIIATFLCILLSANLPIAVALVWVSNPFTIPPMFYFAYKIGVIVLHSHIAKFHFHVSFHWLINEIDTVGPPLLVGSLICGSILAIIGYIAVQWYWRRSVQNAWKKRALNRIKKSN
jgi:hypothetical protein